MFENNHFNLLRLNLSRTSIVLTVCALALALQGCESAKRLGDGLGNMGNKALETVGFKKPEVPAIPDSAKPDRPMSLRIAASDSLNVDPMGRSLSVVVRVYKLRNLSTFLSAPYETFGMPAKEKELLADSLIESREMLLRPDGLIDLKERWAREAAYLGVVALFRTPASDRWRYAFELQAQSAGSGIVMGAHACALSVASGNTVVQGIAPPAGTTFDCPMRKHTRARRTTETAPALFEPPSLELALNAPSSDPSNAP
jgi:type VI secretion system protein VasD